MEIVIDTNILFSFFWKNSTTRKLIITSNFNIISPITALEEIDKYTHEIIKKTRLKEKEFNEELKRLKEIVKFVDKKEYFYFLKDAGKISPDKKDSDFFALCFKYNCLFWTNDSLLKMQNKIRVLNTEEIIELLF